MLNCKLHDFEVTFLEFKKQKIIAFFNQYTGAYTWTLMQREGVEDGAEVYVL